MARDPVHEENGEWYFYDETWAYRHGPFPDEETARETLDAYCKDVLGIDPVLLRR